MNTNQKRPERTYVRKDLVALWRTNVRAILETLGIRQIDLASKLGVTRQSLSTMLNRKDYCLTRIQYLATMHVLKMMLSEMVDAMDSDIYDENYERQIFWATGYYSQIIRDEKEKGL